MDNFELNSRLNIWTCYHLEDNLKNDMISHFTNDSDQYRIQLFNSRKYDYEGENINKYGAFFCEGTAQYYVWKNNLRSDFVVFQHSTRCVDTNQFDELNENEFRFSYSFFNSKSLYDYIVENFGPTVVNDIVQYSMHNGYTKLVNMMINVPEYHYISYNMYMVSWENFNKYMKYFFGLVDYIKEKHNITDEFSMYNYVSSMPNFEDKKIRLFAYLLEYLNYTFYVSECNLKEGHYLGWYDSFCNRDIRKPIEHKIHYVID